MTTTTPTHNSRKSARIADDHDHVDRFSNLPDGLIGHILSKLPIKDAVRTCVFSRGWEFKWTCIDDLHIVAEELFPNINPPDKGNSFRNIVEKILLHLNNVKGFALDCTFDKPLAEPIAISSWISAVLRQRYIESVKLQMHYNTEQGDLVLPRSLLHCPKLKILLVDIQSCIFKVPAEIGFPELTSLSLTDIKIVNEPPNVDTVKFTLPVLKILFLYQCEWSKVKNVEFIAPSLTSIETFYEERFTDGYSINIVGNSLFKKENIVGNRLHDGDSINNVSNRLAEFRADGYSLENFVLTETAVATAFLCLYPSRSPQWTDAGILGELGLRVRKLLKQVSSLQYLKLTTEYSRCVFAGRNLEKLDVDGLLQIVHASPSLEFLKITVIEDPIGYGYDAIESVPSCILSQLKQINFYHSSCHYASELEKFLLKNASELKNVYVYGDNSKYDYQLEDIARQLSEFPKVSKCRIIY